MDLPQALTDGQKLRAFSASLRLRG